MDSQVQEALKTAYPRYEKRRKTRVKMTLDLYVRRQVSAELGDDEPTKDERFILLQKFGVTAPRIDRQMTKPSWMGEAEWKRKLNDWYKSTKGLVPQTQPRRTFRPQQSSAAGQPSVRSYQTSRYDSTRSPRSNQQARPQGTSRFPRNSGPTKTATRPS